MWEYTGRKRPLFAETQGIGQESGWDYSRPLKIIAGQRRVVVCFGDPSSRT